MLLLASCNKHEDTAEVVNTSHMVRHEYVGKIPYKLRELKNDIFNQVPIDGFTTFVP
jgi:hypothetical protein